MYYSNKHKQLRLLATKINSSPQSHGYFLELPADGTELSLAIIQDVSTRWNSTYLMIRRALKRQKAITEWLNAQIKKYAPKRKNKQREAPGPSRLGNETIEPKGNAKMLRVFQSYRLGDQEWIQLRYICALLEPFYNVTERLSQSDTPTINRAWRTYNLLYDHLESQDTEYTKYHGLCYEGEIKNSIKTCRDKLAKYYGKTYGKGGILFNLGVMVDPSVKYTIYDVSYSLESKSSELDAKFV